MKKIAAWGDSITWGASDDQKGGWVSRLRDYYSKTGNEVYNLGISGDKVGGVLERFHREFDDLKPEVVLLAIGINDSPHRTHKKGTPLEVFEARFNKLVGQIQSVSQKIIIIGPTNVIDDHPSKHGYTNTAIKPYSLIIEKLASKNGLPYVDLWGVITAPDLHGDGLHPEAEGHQKIFKKVKNQISLLG